MTSPQWAAQEGVLQQLSRRAARGDCHHYGAVDCGGYVTSFMVAATALGLGTVAQAALAGHLQVVREPCHLPATQLGVCGISFGYADSAHPANGSRTVRATIDEVATLV